MVKLPNITPAQIVAIVGAVIGVLVAAGVDMSQDLQNAVIGLVTVLSSVLIAGDAAIRHGRNKARAAAIAAGQKDPAAQ